MNYNTAFKQEFTYMHCISFHLFLFSMSVCFIVRFYLSNGFRRQHCIVFNNYSLQNITESCFKFTKCPDSSHDTYTHASTLDTHNASQYYNGTTANPYKALNMTSPMTQKLDTTTTTTTSTTARTTLTSTIPTTTTTQPKGGQINAFKIDYCVKKLSLNFCF